MSDDNNPVQTIERTRVKKYDKTHEDDPQHPHEVVTVTALNGKTAIRTIERDGVVVDRFEDPDIIARIATLELGPTALAQHHEAAPVHQVGGSDSGGLSASD